jgi:L-fucose dehydrogenase
LRYSALNYREKMDLNLRDKVIVVTGGARGIGAAICRACGQERALPVILDRDAEAAHELQTRLHGEGIASEVFVVELTRSSDVRTAVETAASRLGRIDGVVNNAGVNDGVGLEHGSPEGFAASLKRNLVHYYAVTQAALPFLMSSKGTIVNIGSKVAVTGQGGTSGYAAAKGAILGLTVEWAIELWPYGIRVNAVVPAEVMTPQYEEWVKKFPDPNEKLHSIASKVPLGRRMTDASEIASAVVFFLSPNCQQLNGQIHFVDGGYVHLDRGLK